MNYSSSESSRDKRIQAFLETLIPGDPANNLPSGTIVDCKCDESFWDAFKILDDASIKTNGKNLVEASATERQSALEILTRKDLISLNRTTKSVVEKYYLRAEVRQALGIGTRPPFPEGYHIYEGDFTLLEPVFERTKIFRDVSKK